MRQHAYKILFFLLMVSVLTVGMIGFVIEDCSPRLENVGVFRLSEPVPGVVSISTPLRHDSTAEQTSGQRGATKQLGSGIVVDAGKGYVVTNDHVIDQAEVFTVALSDGQVFEAGLVGNDPGMDLALLKIEGMGLMALPEGDSDALQVGDFVWAIGRSLASGQTVSAGIVSALGRRVREMDEDNALIRTDAMVNSLNSGGALINRRGQLVGVNRERLGADGHALGIGFAIPINTVKTVVRQLIRYGRIRRGALGIRLQDRPADNASATIDNQGLVVGCVVETSPAAEAGIKKGDRIGAVNGRTVQSAHALYERIALTRLGDRVTLDLLNECRHRSVAVRVAEPVATRCF